MLKELVQKNRSCRRYDHKHKIEESILRELVDLARLCPSAKNLQPLKYMLFNTAEKNALIFQNLRWAVYLQEGGIKIPEGERPSAYIIILGDRTISSAFGCDYGIAAQTILLGAVEKGLGGCIIASINETKLREAVSISARYDILLVIAIGKPAEKIIIEELRAEHEVKYWRDEGGTHHVPKRNLDDVIVTG